MTNVLAALKGKEFVDGALQEWLMKLDIKPIQIYPGSPWCILT